MEKSMSPRDFMCWGLGLFRKLLQNQCVSAASSWTVKLQVNFEKVSYPKQFSEAKEVDYTV